MTLNELLDACVAARERGHEWMTLVVPRKSPPKGERIRLAPGLTGQLLAVNDNGDVVASAKLDDIERYLARCAKALARDPDPVVTRSNR